MCLIQEVINLEDLPESLPNLKTLELTTTNDAFSMNVLIRILICCSNLESLHLIIQKGSLHTSFATEDHDLEFWETDYDCIFERLMTVNMTGISAVPHHTGFIEFLLERSPVLETMSITPCVNMTDEKLNFSIELLRF
ncbi:hypothetical protein L1887_37267 [Cichorium endivia]|nr:hypothetical protein L1887_37267 [Cichorium endivia]